MSIKGTNLPFNPNEKPEGMSEKEWSTIDQLFSLDLKITAIKIFHTRQERQAEEEENRQVVQLCFWPEPKRASPNTCLRSALFAAIQGKKRIALKRQRIAAQGGYEIVFSGWQLDQADFDVLLQALHLAKQHPLGNVCSFTGRGFLKAIGRAEGGNSLEWLKDAIHRLRGAVVEIKTPSSDWNTYNLLSKASGNTLSDTYNFQIDPVVIQLFSPNDWTALEWEQRKQLQRKPLALWLHGYYSSHAKPYPVKVSTLCELSGSKPRNFIGRLQAAFKDLSEVTGWHFLIDEKTLVHCEKPLSLEYKKSA